LCLSLSLSLFLCPHQHHAEQQAAASPHALQHVLLALSCMDETELRREFDKHVDLTAIAAGAPDKGERRMSKGGLAGFMRQHALAHGDPEVERIMGRVDANKDGEIDFGEFRALARANWDLEKVLGSNRLKCVFASVFPVGTTPQDLGAMDSK
jgi:hypothetical protein